MSPRRPNRSTLSLPMTIATLALISLALSSLNPVAGQSADIVHKFVDPAVESFTRLVVNKNTGQVFVGGVNKLYQLSPDLDPLVIVNTGPGSGALECSGTDCPATDVAKKLTNNINKALVIDYSTGRLIACGSLDQGTCTIRNVHNISNVVQEFRKPDAASEVPAVSSGSLSDEKLFEFGFANSPHTRKKDFFDTSLFPINYVYQFSSEEFNYCLTIQPKNTSTGTEFISKLVGVLKDDEDYDSYTEMPIACTNELTKYNLVETAYVSKPGSDLAEDLGITAEDDVLFAVFSESKPASNISSSKSAICVYSLKAISNKFTSNIQNCTSGNGQDGVNSTEPNVECVPTANPTSGDEDPIAASPVLTFRERLTAIAAASTNNDTVVFVGTGNGHLKKVIVQTATSAVPYGDVEVYENSPINSDMRFDPESKHLYVMSRSEVSKVITANCSEYETCSDCTAVKDPNCGWCILENKCSSRSDCTVIPNDVLHWVTYKVPECPAILSVTPDQLPISKTTNLELVMENLPRLTGRFRCAFSVLDKDLTTDARRESDGVNCQTPTTDRLPSVPENEHALMAKLSIRRTVGPDLMATNFTFFDCNSYSSCTECIASRFPCEWCVHEHKCTHDTNETCRGETLITKEDPLVGPTNRSGPASCPRIIPKSSSEIAISSGTTKTISVKVHLVSNFSVQSRFVCQFTIEGRLVSANAQLLGDTMYCDSVKFSYTSNSPYIKVPFVMIWGGSKALDNPDNIHVVIYRCKDMADSCDTCLTVDSKYNCGWCKSSNTCQIRDECADSKSMWIRQKYLCSIQNN